MANKQTMRSARYDKANTQDVRLKLNKKTDADILDHLASLPNKQGYIKSLIRADLEKQKATK